MYKLLPIAFVATLIAGCAVAPQDPNAPSPGMFGMMAKQRAQPQAPAPAPVAAPNPRSDIRIMTSFQPGVSTTTDAVRILGAPTLVNTAPDGRVVYMYDFNSTPQGPMMAGMMFGPNQVLMKIDYFPKGK